MNEEPIAEYQKKCPNCKHLCTTKEYDGELFLYTCKKCKVAGTYRDNPFTMLNETCDNE